MRTKIDDDDDDGDDDGDDDVDVEHDVDGVCDGREYVVDIDVVDARGDYNGDSDDDVDDDDDDHHHHDNGDTDVDVDNDGDVGGDDDDEDDVDGVCYLSLIVLLSLLQPFLPKPFLPKPFIGNVPFRSCDDGSLHGFAREVERYAGLNELTPPANIADLPVSPLSPQTPDDPGLALVNEFEMLADLVQRLNEHEVSLPELQRRATLAPEEPAVAPIAPQPSHTMPQQPEQPRQIAQPSSSKAPQEQPGQQQDHRDDQGWHDGAWRDDSWPSQRHHAGSWHHGSLHHSDWRRDNNWSWGNEPYRYGTNGGRERSGYSGGSNRVYYKGFYHAKGKGKAAVARYVEAYGEPPAKGTGRCYHEQACRSYFA